MSNDMPTFAEFCAMRERQRRRRLVVSVAVALLVALAAALLLAVSARADTCISGVVGDEPPVVVCWLWLPMVVAD